MTAAFTVIAGDTVRAQALALVDILDPSVPGGPGSAALSVTAGDPHVRAHLVQGTLVLTGRADLALPHLGSSAATLLATIQPAGAAVQDVVVVVPAATVLPFIAPPVRLDVAPVAVIGSVTAAAFPHGPVAGSEVVVAGTVPDGSILAARTPLALTHDAGTTLRAVALTDVATTTTATVTPAGATSISLTAAAGAATGAVLALGPVETVEHVVVDAVTGTDVTLRTPTARTWPAGVGVTRVTVAAGASTALVRAARPGDGVLVVAAATAAAAVEISDIDPTRVEYRATGARSDSAGRWRLGGVRGVPSLTLTVSAGGFLTVGPSDRRLDAGRDPNVLDTVLTV